MAWRGTLANYPKNPYAKVHECMWRFWLELKRREPSTALGGFYASKPGYHNTRSANVDHGARNKDTDYSIRYAQDRTGPDTSAAIDWSFPEAWSGDYRRSAHFGVLVHRAFLARDPRLAGWREFLGQIDQDASLSGEGLDFYTWTTRTPDTSHKTHHHLSKTRSRLGVWADYLNMLSILDGETLVAWRARTTQATTDGDTDMGLTAPQDGALQRVNDIYNGTSPAQAKLDLTLAGILAAATNDDEAGIRAAINAKAVELERQIGNVDEAVLERIGTAGVTGLNILLRSGLTDAERVELATLLAAPTP